MSNEEWTTVTKNDKKRVFKGSKKAKQGKILVPHASSSSAEPSLDKERILSAIRQCVTELHDTDLLRSLLPLIKQIPEPIQAIVCYGVGNFSSHGLHSAPMWQLACALCIRESFNVTERLIFYDPCTTDLEKELLRDLEVDVMGENERGCRSVDAPTLFWMPHCPQLLYANVVLSNWKTLHNVYILGNSLCAYSERQIGIVCAGIEALTPFLREEELQVSKRDSEVCVGNLEGAFNDCHWIRIEADCLPDKPEPNNNDDLYDSEVV